MSELEARFFPFNRLGLRRNPFGSLSDEEWLRVTVMPPAIAAALKQNARHFQFTGDSGRGKTTLLMAVRQHFIQQGENIPFEKLLEHQHRFITKLQDVDGFALDEAQRLNWLERRCLFRSIGNQRLLITTHEDLTGWFRRYGLPVIHISAEACLTRDHLADVLARRLEFFAREDGHGVSFAPDAIDYLWQTYGTHLRGIEYFLYEVFQRLREPKIIHAADF